jgi:hypothetical protein
VFVWGCHCVTRGEKQTIKNTQTHEDFSALSAFNWCK